MHAESIQRETESAHPVHTEVTNILVNVLLRQLSEDSAQSQEENACVSF